MSNDIINRKAGIIRKWYYAVIYRNGEPQGCWCALDMHTLGQMCHANRSEGATYKYEVIYHV